MQFCKVLRYEFLHRKKACLFWYVEEMGEVDTALRLTLER